MPKLVNPLAVEDFDQLEPDGEDPSLDVGDLSPEERPDDERITGHASFKKTAAKKKRRPLVVPYRREVKVGDKGSDVLAYKRALAAMGLLSWPVKTSEFTIYTRKTVRHFQKTHKLHVDGVIGPATYRKLLALKAFDAWGAHLMQSYHPTAPDRAKLVAVAEFARHHAPRHYTMGPGRTDGLVHKIHPPQMWWYADCSAFVLWCAYVALGYEEARNRFGPLDGYTGTLLQAGHSVSLSSAKMGDLVHYEGHVAMLTDQGQHVDSHGHEGGPFFERARYRSDIIDVRSHLP